MPSLYEYACASELTATTREGADASSAGSSSLIVFFLKVF